MPWDGTIKMTTFITADARDTAIGRARGPYQIGLIDGINCWSGSDFVGRARTFGGSYAKSRANLIAACRKAGLRVVLSDIGERGKTVAMIATDAEAKRIRKTPTGGDTTMEGTKLRRRIEIIAAAARRRDDRDDAALATVV